MISEYKHAEFLEKVYGKLPIALHEPKQVSDGLNIGQFETKTEQIKAIALKNDDVFDYLVEVYNQDFLFRLGRLKRFERSLPLELQEQFKFSFEEKRKKLKIFLKISEKRLEFLSFEPQDDEKKASLSQFESQLALYKNEFLAKLPSSFFFTKTFESCFPLSQRKLHSYIIGSSGSGKSELVKMMIYNDLKTKSAIVLLDPHGDVALSCSKLRGFGKEIIYISAEYGKYNYFPKYNPFNHSYHGKPEVERRAFISVKSQELLNAFQVVFSVEFSQNMKRIISNCLQVMLNTPGLNLRDFMRMLRPATEAPYLQLAAQHYSQDVRDFFEHDFGLKTLSVTKQSVLTRFENALSNYYLNHIFDCRESSFDIKKLIDQGKCVLINASKGILGTHGSKILGSFLVSELVVHAFQRSKILPQYRRNAFIYIDEAQNFISDDFDTLLSEIRKYNLFAVLAHQYINQISDSQIRDSVMANTGIKCCGKVSAKDFEYMKKELEFKGNTQPKLGQGKFLIKARDYNPILIQAYDFLIKESKKDFLSPKEHRRRLNENIRTYYTISEPKSAKNEAEKLSKKQKQIPVPKIEKIL